VAGGRVPAPRGEAGALSSPRAYAANLGLNVAWSWIFCRARRPVAAAVEAAGLAGSTAALARRSWARDRGAGMAMLPYAAWTAFAAVLTATLARRNR